jgi:hypothetical protein
MHWRGGSRDRIEDRHAGRCCRADLNSEMRGTHEFVAFPET